MGGGEEGRKGKVGREIKGEGGKGLTQPHKVTSTPGREGLFGCVPGPLAPQMWAHSLLSTQCEAHPRVCGHQVGGRLTGEGSDPETMSRAA